MSPSATSPYAGPGTGAFYTPFNLHAEPMERLLLINLTDGQAYTGFEPQVFDDDVTGRGLRVLAYRPDGVIDLYYEPTLKPSSEILSLGAAPGDQLPITFERRQFDVKPNGLDVDIAFTDKAGRQIALRVCDHNPQPPVGLALLAPLGSAVPDPRFLPLFLMDDFSFVRRRNTEVRVTIDGTVCELVKMPVPIGGAFVYFTRYCLDPFIVFWNKNTETALTPVPVSAAGVVSVDGVDYQLTLRDGHPEIASLTLNDGPHSAHLAFDPPFPDVAALQEGATVTGTFTVGSKPVIGQVSGVYEATRQDGQTRLRLHPDGGWQPNDPHFSARMVFTVARVFRTWPKTYEWTATLTPGAGDALDLAAGWQRLN